MRPYVYDDKFEIPVYSHFLPKKHGLTPDLDVSRHPLSNHVGLVFFTARDSFILNKNHFSWSLAKIAAGQRPGCGRYGRSMEHPGFCVLT